MANQAESALLLIARIEGTIREQNKAVELRLSAFDSTTAKLQQISAEIRESVIALCKDVSELRRDVDRLEKAVSGNGQQPIRSEIRAILAECNRRKECADAKKKRRLAYFLVLTAAVLGLLGDLFLRRLF